jgi:PKD repeat protein
MKLYGNIPVLILISIFYTSFSKAQSYQNKFVQSLGASYQRVGNIDNSIIIGEIAVSSELKNDSFYRGSVGFLTKDLYINSIPVAIAGKDFLIEEGMKVQLDGSSSFDNEKDFLKYNWLSLDGIQLESENQIRPTFTAPDVVSRKKFRFVLSVYDGEFSSVYDTVVVTVTDPEWKVSVKTNSVITYALVSINEIPAEVGDLVGVFIDGKCRAVGEIIKHNGKSYSIFNIQSELQERALFKVYDLSEDKICDMIESKLTLPGKELGSFLNPIQVNAECNILSSSFRSNFTTICEGQAIRIDFNGGALENTTFIWNFDGGKILNGSDRGPFDIIWDTPGEKKISLRLKKDTVTSPLTEKIINIKKNFKDTLSEFVCESKDTVSKTMIFNSVNGCDSIIVVNKIKENVQFKLRLGEEICSSNNFIEALIISGSGSFKYNWNNGDNNPIINIMKGGLYTLTLTSPAGCKYIDSIKLNDFSLNVEMKALLPSSCDKPTGKAKVNVINGEAPFTFKWDNGEKDSIAVSLSTGKHFVTVVDSKGCTQVSSVNISSTGFPIIKNVLVSDISCQKLGSISVDVAGGSPPYKFIWSNGKDSSSVLGLEKGDYDVTVTDKFGCKTELEDLRILDKSSVLTLDFLQKSCNVELKVSNGSAPFTYLWNNGNKTNIPVDKTIIGKNYFVTVTDSKGCIKKDSFFSKTGLVDASFSYLVEGKTKLISFLGHSSGFNLWDFGDGTTSTESNPVHQYSKPGKYTVIRKTNNSCGINSFSSIVLVSNFYENKSPSDSILVGKPEKRDTFIIVKQSSPDFPSNDNLQPFKCLIYPNPGDGLFVCRIFSELMLDMKYFIFDLAGNIIKNGKFQGKNINLEIDISDFPDATYLFYIENENFRYQNTLVKQSNN